MDIRSLSNQLKELPATSFVEFLGPSKVMAPDIVARLPNSSLIGRAMTCYCAAGDNLPMHAALAAAQPGDILVIASERRAGTGLWGELATRSASARGVQGVVADGAIRDVATIRQLQFPVWSRHVSPIGAAKLQEEGRWNIPVSCGGVVVNPGDFIVADEDGIVVIPSSHIEAAATAASARVQAELAAHPALQRGALPLDALARSSSPT